MWRLPVFLLGSFFSFVFFLMMFVCLGLIHVPRPVVKEHPDGWYQVQRVCHKTRVGGYDWKESCVDDVRRAR